MLSSPSPLVPTAQWRLCQPVIQIFKFSLRWGHLRWKVNNHHLIMVDQLTCWPPDVRAEMWSVEDREEKVALKHGALRSLSIYKQCESQWEGFFDFHWTRREGRSSVWIGHFLLWIESEVLSDITDTKTVHLLTPRQLDEAVKQRHCLTNTSEEKYQCTMIIWFSH